MTLQTSLSAPALSAAISLAAAVEKRFGGPRDSSGRTSRNWLAAAGAEQDLGQPQLGEQGARQHFAQQADPVRAPGEDLVGVLRRRRQEAVVDAEKFAFKKDLQGHAEAKSSLYHVLY